MPSPSPESIKALAQLNLKLMDLHKDLLMHQSRRAEAEDGRKFGPFDLLKLAMEDPRFAWLRRLSGLITRIDIHVSGDKETEPFDLKAVLAEAEGLLNGTFPDFAARYGASLAADPLLSARAVHVKEVLARLKPIVDARPAGPP